ncbi:ultraviolet-B receptor UVR8 [Punica granatum]|uniref:Ultraviolet-B receptor UVR8 n=1 Tax=Punica granatum TaxID=22663 RepID=A0A6P8D483_PUNGR|nr:ultraviolet-B receptor UVR8 [Punica granatum]
MEVNEDVPEAHQEGDEEEEQQQQVWSWGAGTDGQLGTGRLQDELLPQPLSLPAVSLLSCGGAHVVALSSGGRVLTWGRGSSGQLGHGEVVNHCLKPKPVTFPVSFPITHVSAGWSHSGFVSDTGRLFTCGDGSFGQLGHGDFSSHCCPVEVLYFASKNVGQVACGMRHSLVLLKGEIHSQVYGFGSCKRGQIGSHDVRMKSVNIPQVIDGFKNIDIVSISANGDHSAALSADGSLYYWGRGFPGSPDYHSPAQLDSSLVIKQVALGWNHSLILTDAGEVSMLGGRHHGILSDPEKIGKNSFPAVADRREPALERVPGLDGVKAVDISAGAEHSALVTEDGLTKTWGWGEHGQLGLGDTRDQILPQNVFLDQGQSNGGARCRVYCGSGFTYAIRTRNLFP